MCAYIEIDFLIGCRGEGGDYYPRLMNLHGEGVCIL